MTTIPDLTTSRSAAAETAAVARTTLAQAQTITVNTPVDADTATEALRQLRARRKQIEAERDRVSKPLRALATENSRYWKPAIDAYSAAETAINRALTAFETTRQARAKAALVASAPPEQIAEVVELMAPRPEGTHQRTYYSARVTDASKVPAEYMIPDQAALDALARAKKDGFAVPGVELVRDVLTVVRS